MEIFLHHLNIPIYLVFAWSGPLYDFADQILLSILILIEYTSGELEAVKGSINIPIDLLIHPTAIVISNFSRKKQLRHQVAVGIWQLCYHQLPSATTILTLIPDIIVFQEKTGINSL